MNQNRACIVPTFHEPTQPATKHSFGFPQQQQHLPGCMAGPAHFSGHVAGRQNATSFELCQAFNSNVLRQDHQTGFDACCTASRLLHHLLSMRSMHIIRDLGCKCLMPCSMNIPVNCISVQAVISGRVRLSSFSWSLAGKAYSWPELPSILTVSTTWLNT